MTNPPTPRALRADAVRTRKALLSAATEAFAEQGTDASIAQIAQRAGIGKGTVFRHYATKQDLVAAIVCEMLDELVATGERLSQAADPATALHEFMSAEIELQAGNQAFCEVVSGATLQHPDVRAGIDRLWEVVERLTDRARRQGAIRPDITGQDIMLLLNGVYQTAAPLMGTEPQLWHRYLALVLDGMQPEAARALPHPPPGRLEFTSIPSTPEPAG
jgi:AcrR family transcriptional regulator